MNAGAYALALALTVLLETALAALLAPRAARRRTAFTAVVLNLFTHPLATLALLHASSPLLGLEVLVAAIEALGYHGAARLSLARALLIALPANAATAAVGVLLWS
jgi:hypothetical protein